MLIAKFLFLLLVANGMPVILARILGQYGNQPLDGGIKFYDGRYLFGPSKTFRGLLGALIATPVIAMIIGWTFLIGLLIAIGAMAGDLFSSFCKRRLGLHSSSMALGIDQIPESLFPALLCFGLLQLSWIDVVLITIIFFVGELLLSQVLYRLRIRKTPY